jgi:hypothetical protein
MPFPVAMTGEDAPAVKGNEIRLSALVRAWPSFLFFTALHGGIFIHGCTSGIYYRMFYFSALKQKFAWFIFSCIRRKNLEIWPLRLR